MKKQSINLLFISILLMMLAACKEDMDYKEIAAKDPSPPAKVINIVVENQEGKVKLTYGIPNDLKLSYVKAVYEIRPNQSIEVKSSAYNNTIMLEGFSQTREYTVKLYSVSRSEVMSEPVTVTVKPLEAPIWKVFKSIKIIDAFGGYNLQALNPTKGNIGLVVMKRNVVKEYEIDNQKSVFTAADAIDSKIRGLDTTRKEFAFFVRDRWGNSTDTLYRVIKPIYESELPSNRFRNFTLPGDAPQNASTKVEYMWDGRLGWPYTSFTLQANGGPGPHMITFDTGTQAKLSRIWIRPYPEVVKDVTRYFYFTTMKKFEIYGSSNPSLSGVLDNSWTLLGSYELIKPSGLPYGSDSVEDVASGAAGFSWDVDLAAPKVRYIRIRCLENFAGGTAQSINELKVYGDTRP